MQEHDAVIIGAGVSGMHQLHRFRGLGLSTYRELADEVAANGDEGDVVS